MNAIQVTQSNYDTEVTQSDRPVLIDFWAPWCGPCRALAPVLDEIATEHGDRFKIAKIDVDQDPELASKFRVRGVPTLLFVKDGEPREQHLGGLSKSEIVKRLAALS